MASSQNEVPEQVVDKSESSPEEVPEDVPDKSSSASSSLRDKGGERITKPKNPGRVAAGKRLAEMNRKNKAMKNPDRGLSNHLNINWGYVIAGGGLLIAVGSLYYAYKEHQRAESKVVRTETVLGQVENPLPVSADRGLSPKKKLMEME